ncbi:(d)CMP kinase [Planococcus shenhongbingii]|uniref:Cytidylate kinase n=1 Tax=Planococcus shenhongbingii TaxID=3058398 RepID=A0ABT8N856_9BACL|nr:MULTISPECIES: (d)CMP kinase [unclassified Planococcus (in: firmicutes)]MDN7244068.1 (d)CMP kinase [Planococcus sp. N017]WKA57245.1 (d)CMP kinase [Planococcus sp. N016]
MTKSIQIALDGPAAAGKSTIAKIVAEQLGYIYIDTGAMYRAITLKALNEGIDLSSNEEAGKLLADTEIDLQPSENGQLVFLDNKDVTEDIRSQHVTKAVSEMAAHESVRTQMVKLQQQLAEERGVVMDGRDIGTDVLPAAKLKVFMSATVEERARRRFEENKKRSIHTPIDELQAEIAKRDKMDSEREVSPLRQAEDAIFLDTTFLTIREAAAEILRLAEERLS